MNKKRHQLRTRFLIVVGLAASFVLAWLTGDRAPRVSEHRDDAALSFEVIGDFERPPTITDPPAIPSLDETGDIPALPSLTTADSSAQLPKSPGKSTSQGTFYSSSPDPPTVPDSPTNACDDLAAAGSAGGEIAAQSPMLRITQVCHDTCPIKPTAAAPDFSYPTATDRDDMRPGHHNTAALHAARPPQVTVPSAQTNSSELTETALPSRSHLTPDPAVPSTSQDPLRARTPVTRASATLYLPLIPRWAPVPSMPKIEMRPIPLAPGTDRQLLHLQSRYLVSITEIAPFREKYNLPTFSDPADAHVAFATYDEAVAFTAWLTHKHRQYGLIPQCRHYRLPRTCETRSTTIWLHDTPPTAELRPFGIVLAEGSMP